MFHTRRWPHLFIIAIIVLVSLGGTQPAQAAGQVYRVTTTADVTGTCQPGENSFCSLRQAINGANANPGSTIKFFINDSDIGDVADPDDGYKTIGPASAWFIVPKTPLPALALGKDGTTISGETQTANLGNRNPNGPEIIIVGSAATVNTSGLTIFSNGNTVRNLGFANFTGTNDKGFGIEIYGNTNTIQGNYIGVSLDPTSGATTAKGNGDAGIRIRGANNIIGGDNALQTTQFNVIAGNLRDGIIIDGAINSVASGNIIQGNYIGIAPNINTAGFQSIPNGGNGIQIRNQFASRNRIGPPANADNAVFRNYISGNGEYGILIKDSPTNEVYGNFIGLDLGGTNRVPNGQGGILIDGPLGTDVLPSASGNLIGSAATFFSHNYVAGNNGPGIHIRGPGAASNKVEGNYVGLGSNNRIPGGAGSNQTVGVLIEQGANNNTVGGSRAFISGLGYVGRNFISGNNGDGIRIQGRYIFPNIDEQSNSNIVIGNCIGVVPLNAPPFFQACNTGFGVIPNQGDGVKIDTNARLNQIGNPNVPQRNIIAFNTGHGVEITGPTITYQPPRFKDLPRVDSNSVFGNIIDFNGGNGVFVNETVNTQIDGGNAQNRSSMSFNGANGIQVTGAISTTIFFSRAGGNRTNGILIDTASYTTSLRSTQALTNTLNGIQVQDSTSVSMQGMLVRLNSQNGIIINNVTPMAIRTSSVLTNSLDGIRTFNTPAAIIDGSAIQANLQHGIVVDGDRISPITRNTSITNNTIRQNAGVGVLVTRNGLGQVDQVSILDNSFTRNGAGINLEPSTDGVPGNPTNPNHDIDPPVTDPASPLRMRLTQSGVLSGYVYTSTNKITPFPASACITCTIQVFKPDPTLATPDGQGFAKIGETKEVAENGFFSVQLTGVPPLPPQILFTATDGYGNTSEFAAFVRRFGLEIGPARISSAVPGQAVVYTHRITNTGTIDLDRLELTAVSSQKWGTSVQLPSPTLPAGSSAPVTITLQLPTGADPSVRAGVVDETTVTIKSADPSGEVVASASLVNRTTVQAQFLLEVSPLSRTGIGQGNTTIPYVYTVKNNGNITGTVNIAAVTLINNVPVSNWITTSTLNSVELGPGKSSDVTINVKVPQDAQSNVVATTRIDFTVPSTPSQNKTATATTTVQLNPRATMIPNRSGDAAAGATIRFFHTVTNLSNGTVTFKLNGGSSLGSRFVFGSNTPGITLNADNTFTLSNAPGANIFNFYVDITINNQAREGQTELVTLFLTDTQGNSIGGASVQDTIRVSQSLILPRVWVPLALRQGS